jgi:hypothetical protein
MLLCYVHEPDRADNIVFGRCSSGRARGRDEEGATERVEFGTSLHRDGRRSGKY